MNAYTHCYWVPGLQDQEKSDETRAVLGRSDGQMEEIRAQGDRASTLAALHLLFPGATSYSSHDLFYAEQGRINLERVREERKTKIKK